MKKSTIQAAGLFLWFCLTIFFAMFRLPFLFYIFWGMVGALIMVTIEDKKENQ